MLRIHTGHDTRYFTDAVAKGREGYYTDAIVAGEPPGVWYGAGATALGLSGEVDADLLEAVYAHRLDPRDPASRDKARWTEAARLGRPPKRYKTANQLYEQLVAAEPDAGPERRAQLRAQAERSARAPVSFYDMTFSPSKTVTVLWAGAAQAAQEARAAGDDAATAFWSWTAEQVEAAVLDGARAGLDYAQEVACYARTGHHGGGAGRWVQGRGLIAAQFLQHDTRNGDPQLHVHQTVDNLVECPDGQYRALDGRVLHTARGAIAAVSERGCEASLYRRFGVAVETRSDGKAREVVGANLTLANTFSSRHADIARWTERVIARFRETYGRDPTPAERDRIGEQAFLATRPPKSHQAQTRSEQLARWDAQARTVRGDGLAGEARAILAHLAPEAQAWSAEDVVSRALAGVGASKAAWTRWDLLRAVCEALPGHLGLRDDAETRTLLDQLTDAALTRAVRLTPEQAAEALAPDGLRREDGSSLYDRPGAVYYATREQLAGEHTVRHAAAARREVLALSGEHAEQVLAAFAASGAPLGADQAAALRGVLTSSAPVEVLVAAAGTGKSFTVGAIADGWAEQGRRVFGLAAWETTADLLAEDGLTTANITAWAKAQHRLDAGAGLDGDEAFRLRRGDLVVVDEASTAAADELAEITERCAAAGAKLVLVGDPAQLGAVGPAGGFADVIERAPRYELTEVRRFTESWEAEASLRLRERDPDVLAEYAARGRLHDGGTADQAAQLAERLWLADTLTGREALLQVGTNEAAAASNARLREALVRLRRVAHPGVELTEHGGIAGVGDLVQARRNARHLIGYHGNGYAPINRKAYRVLGTRDNGALVVARVTGRDEHGGEQLAAAITLPAGYVGEHVALGYASTVHAAQGRTTDTSYHVVDAGTDAAALYVGMSRGRLGNWACVTTRSLAPDAETGQTLDVPASSPAAVLGSILERAAVLEDDQAASPGECSALTYAERAAEQARSTVPAVDRLAAEAAELATERTAAALDRLIATGLLTPADRGAVASDERYPALVGLLRTVELAGHDPDQVLTSALGERSLHGARSPVNVLCARIHTNLHGRLSPQLTGYADLLPRHVPDDYQAVWAARVAAADQRRAELGARVAEQPPRWAIDTLGPVPDEPLARAGWEHRAGWAASYRELIGHTDETDPLGRPPAAAAPEKLAIWRTARHALGLSDADARNPAAELSDGALRARVRAAQRESRFAPPWVRDQLEATHQLRQRRQADATLWAARAATLTDPAERAQLTTDAHAARADVAALTEQCRHLETVDTARADWYAHTAVTRQAGADAQAELDARGVSLDDPDQHTTAAEWLAVDHEATAAEDEHRPVYEHDLADPNRDTARHVQRNTDRSVQLDAADAVVDTDPPLVETAAPDIRDTTTRHPSEDHDPDRDRATPTPDELVEHVERARRATAELGARRRADTARAAEEAADRDRRDQLARWADDDHHADHSHDRAAGTDRDQAADTEDDLVLDHQPSTPPRFAEAVDQPRASAQYSVFPAAQ